MAAPKVEIFTSKQCPYCVWAKRFFEKRGIDYEEFRVDLDEGKREEMLSRTQRTSVPQIFIGDRHIGGYTEMVELDQEGKLGELAGWD